MTAPFQHAITWFEIPVRNLERAQAFYETLLGAQLRPEEIGGQRMAVFTGAQGGIGCLISGSDLPAPSAAGTLIYLNAGTSLDATLARVAGAGGKISTPRTALPGDMGCFAHVTDTEGNRVGLHAPR
jgi:uncharacterized protein